MLTVTHLDLDHCFQYDDRSCYMHNRMVCRGNHCVDLVHIAEDFEEGVVLVPYL